MANALKIPKKLQRGDTVTVVQPSGRLDSQKFKQTVAELRRLGFCVALYPKRLSKDRFFASSDEDRSRELEWALTQPGIRGVFIARGGYGSVRTLQSWADDSKKMKRLRKAQARIVVGYSDATYLLHWLHNQLGWVSFHGPLVGFLDAKRLKNFVKDVLELPVSDVLNLKEARVNRGGSAKGKLLGGNLSNFETDGPAALPKEPMILLIEDVNENFYEIDRLLWKLIQAGYRNSVRAVLLGKFLNCGKTDKSTFRWERVLDTVKKLCRGPILENLRFGHGVKSQRIWPIGAKVQLSGRRLRISK